MCPLRLCVSLCVCVLAKDQKEILELFDYDARPGRGEFGVISATSDWELFGGIGLTKEERKQKQTCRTQQFLPRAASSDVSVLVNIGTFGRKTEEYCGYPC